VIDRTYPLSEVREALRYLETGNAQGKVVITFAMSVDRPTAGEAIAPIAVPT
jgi:hypothetical protein